MDGPPDVAQGANRNATFHSLFFVYGCILYAMSTAAAAAASTFPYRRLEPGEYSTDAILSQFRSCGFCWLKLGTGKNPSSTIEALKSYAKDDMGAYERKWTVENRGKFSSDNELGATQVLGCDSTLLPGKYYVSTIISGEDRASLSKLFQLLPFDSGIPSLDRRTRTKRHLQLRGMPMPTRICMAPSPMPRKNRLATDPNQTTQHTSIFPGLHRCYPHHWKR